MRAGFREAARNAGHLKRPVRTSLLPADGAASLSDGGSGYASGGLLRALTLREKDIYLK